MIMMGARGSMECYTVAPYLAQISNPVHLVFCIGSNDTLHVKIKNVHFPSHISVSIIGFTTQISEIMRTATIILTKSGSVSFAESIYIQLPMILDATTTVLAWERLNHIMLKEKLLGEIVKSHTEIPRTINRLLQNKKILSGYHHNLQVLPKEDPSIIIPTLIEELLN
jgi:processive 1,2-diacylglycerol beta-glucosyltransferase